MSLMQMLLLFVQCHTLAAVQGWHFLVSAPVNSRHSNLEARLAHWAMVIVSVHSEAIRTELARRIGVWLWMLFVVVDLGVTQLVGQRPNSALLASIRPHWDVIQMADLADGTFIVVVLDTQLSVHALVAERALRVAWIFTWFFSKGHEWALSTYGLVRCDANCMALGAQVTFVFFAMLLDAVDSISANSLAKVNALDVSRKRRHVGGFERMNQ